MTEKQPTQKRLHSEIDDEEIVELPNLDSISTSPECSSTFSMKSHNAKSTASLPKPLTLPENIPAEVIDVLQNKPNHPKFYSARVTLVRKAVRFFSALCPYPSSSEYIAIIEKLGEKFPHLKDPGTKSIYCMYII